MKGILQMSSPRGDHLSPLRDRRDAHHHQRDIGKEHHLSLELWFAVLGVGGDNIGQEIDVVSVLSFLSTVLPSPVHVSAQASRHRPPVFAFGDAPYSAKYNPGRPTV